MLLAPANKKIGSGSIQKVAAPYIKIFHFELLISELLM